MRFLKTPFKSPLHYEVAKPRLFAGQLSSPSAPIADRNGVSQSQTSSPTNAAASRTSCQMRKPFKSPIGNSNIDSGLHATATVLDLQVLERRVQVLKRAIKIVSEDDDAELEALGRKWREIGQEVACQLWNESLSRNSGNWSGNEDNYEVSQAGYHISFDLKGCDSRCGEMIDPPIREAKASMQRKKRYSGMQESIQMIKQMTALELCSKA